MADQVAVAIDNARLYSTTQEALDATHLAYGQLSHEAWIKLTQKRTDLTIRSDTKGVSNMVDIWRPEMEQAWNEEKTIQIDKEDTDGKHPLAVPIKVRGTIIGVLNTHKSSEIGRWTPNEISLLETIAEQLGIALDSARLFAETQQSAEEERLIGEITARMRETLDIETVLKTATRELRKSLDLAEVEIQLTPAADEAE